VLGASSNLKETSETFKVFGDSMFANSGFSFHSASSRATLPSVFSIRSTRTRIESPSR
jgi:hypothetical protein